MHVHVGPERDAEKWLMTIMFAHSMSVKFVMASACPIILLVKALVALSTI